MFFGAQATSGLLIAGTSTFVEWELLRQFPALKALLASNRALAIAASVIVTMLISSSVGASGVPVLIGQTASTALSMRLVYRARAGRFGRTRATIVEILLLLDAS